LPLKDTGVWDGTNGGRLIRRKTITSSTPIPQWGINNQTRTGRLTFPDFSVFSTGFRLNQATDFVSASLAFSAQNQI
jgi:hypothetical protein